MMATKEPGRPMQLNLAHRSPYEVILAGFGMLLIGIAAIAFLLGAVFVLRSEPTDGRVVAYQVSPKAAKAKTPEATAARAPVIEFQTRDGRTVRIVGTFYEREPSLAIGDRVSIRYAPAEPEAGVIDVFTEKWGFPLGFAVAGLLFIAVSRLFRLKPA